jgi:hypothetical protein
MVYGKNCFFSLCIFNVFKLADAMKSVHQQCSQLAQKILFDEVEEADVVELLESHKEPLLNQNYYSCTKNFPLLISVKRQIYLKNRNLYRS